jgi:hypothetical protein
MVIWDIPVMLEPLFPVRKKAPENRIGLVRLVSKHEAYEFDMCWSPSPIRLYDSHPEAWVLRGSLDDGLFSIGLSVRLAVFM